MKVEGGVYDPDSRLPAVSQDLRKRKDRPVRGPPVQPGPGAGH